MKHQALQSLTAASIVVLAIMAAAPAHAMPDNWYLGLSGDLTWLSHTNMGGGGNVDLGTRLWPSDMGDFRLEGELGYHGASNKGPGNTHYFTYMGNLYYDLNVFHGPIVPYVGAGLGDTTLHSGQGSNGNAFAYQFMGGLNFRPSSMASTEWYAGYRYQGSDRTDGARLNANNLEVGVRFHL